MEDALKRLTKVLCAVDIYDDSRRVFAHALALARSHDAKLYVLHAASPELPFNRGATERVDFLRRLRSLAEAAGVDVCVEVQRGYVAEIILLHARSREPDVIVLGMSGQERRRGLSGWIAEQVLRDAPCPTLIVPKTSKADVPTFDSILCAVDFSPASQAAVNEALRLASSGGRHLTLLHVVQGPDNRQRLQYGWLGTHEYYRDQGTVALDKLRFLVPPPQRATVSTEVIVGQPAEEILRATRAIDASLLIIGAGGRTRVGSRLFGTTGTLLRDSTCPVLAVPVRKAIEAGAEHDVKIAA
jgi:nucleotide-binding universal stress UspA family protein